MSTIEECLLIPLLWLTYVPVSLQSNINFSKSLDSEYILLWLLLVTGDIYHLFLEILAIVYKFMHILRTAPVPVPYVYPIETLIDSIK